MAKDMLSAVEVAERYDVDRNTVLRWATLGLLPGAFQLGNSLRAPWVIPASALEGFTPPRPGRRPRKRQ